MKEYTHLKEDFDRMKSERSNWDIMYQVLGEYISQVKQNFQGQPSEGQFLNDTIFDSTGTFAAHNAASAMLGMLWPGTTKQAIDIAAPEDMPESAELDNFYENMAKKLIRAMDDPKANLQMALSEYMLDQLIFGTSGIGVEKGDESKLLFKAYGIKELYIDEGKNGRVDKCALFYEWDVRRVVEEYGEDNVSEKVRKVYTSGKKQKVKILVVIQQRKRKKAEKGKLAMKYESMHVEYETCHLLREDGFHEFPIAVVRFTKLMYEKYGRSPSMAAMPDIKESNTLREAVIIATEKTLDMPIGVIDDGMLGGGYIDTSARAVTVFNASNNIGNTPPVFNIGEVPDVRYAETRLEKLAESISQHFSIDRLIDFNNDTQMTFGEAQIRDQIRTASLAGLFARQISEGFTPIIERSVAILLREGEFGVEPDSIEERDLIAQSKEPTYFPEEILKRLKNGEDFYTITYKTKAANASKAEEYLGIIDVMGVASQMIAVDASIGNRVNTHEALKRLADIRGAGAILFADDEVAEKEAQQQQQLQQQQMLQAADQVATIGEKAANIDKTMAQA